MARAGGLLASVIIVQKDPRRKAQLRAQWQSSFISSDNLKPAGRGCFVAPKAASFLRLSCCAAIVPADSAICTEHVPTDLRAAHVKQGTIAVTVPLEQCQRQLALGHSVPSIGHRASQPRALTECSRTIFLRRRRCVEAVAASTPLPPLLWLFTPRGANTTTRAAWRARSRADNPERTERQRLVPGRAQHVDPLCALIALERSGD